MKKINLKYFVIDLIGIKIEKNKSLYFLAHQVSKIYDSLFSRSVVCS